MAAKDRSFFRPQEIAPIPALADLWRQVTEHSPDRLPKWKFRLAGGVVELQPQNGPRERFKGRCPGMTFTLAASFLKPGKWLFEPKSVDQQNIDDVAIQLRD